MFYRCFMIALIGVVPAALGCSGEVSTGEHAGSGSSAGAGGMGGAGAGGAGGAGGGGGGLSDHYMKRLIGDCINEEEWLSFSPPTSFIHTFVDRNYCTSHSVVASPGKQALSGDVLEVTWDTLETSNLRRFTFARVDPMPSSLAPEPVEGYQLGTAALNATAYARTADPLVWHREDISTITDVTATFDRRFSADIAFNGPLSEPNPSGCSMTITLFIQASYDAAPETANETLTLPCSIAPDADLPWVRVWATGFENPFDGKWWDYLDQLGIPSKYGSLVNNVLYESFYPVLYFVPGDEAHVFQDLFQPWYFEYLNGPPTEVP